MGRSRSGVVVLVIVFLMAALPRVQAQSLSDSFSGRIEFQSFTPASMFELARERRYNWRGVNIWSHLSLPVSTEGKMPAMVLSHGSAGMSAGEDMVFNHITGLAKDKRVYDATVECVKARFGTKGVADLISDLDFTRF